MEQKGRFPRRNCRKRSVCPKFSHSLTYTDSALNRLSTLTDNRLVTQGNTSGVTNYGYDAVSNLSGYTYPNGVQTSYNYDGLNRLTQMGSAERSIVRLRVHPGRSGQSSDRGRVERTHGELRLRLALSLDF